MNEEIIVPVLGESITEATVTKWLKNKGAGAPKKFWKDWASSPAPAPLLVTLAFRFLSTKLLMAI